MEPYNLQTLKQEAKARTHAHPGTRTILLVYLGVLAVLSLSSSAPNLYLNSQISGTGGLSGLGMRSMLQTIQSVLIYVNVFFGPFWQAGFLYSVIRFIHAEQTALRDLGEGFRRFGRIFSYTMNNALITVLLFIVSVYAAGLVFSLSPWGADFAEAMGPVLTDPNLITADGMVNLDLIPMDAMLLMMKPMLILIAIIYVPLQLMVSYCLRAARYLMMTHKHIGGLAAMILSLRITRGHRMRFFKLDLSYWYYYLLLALATVLGYLMDLILPSFGVVIPLNPTVLYFAGMVIYLAAELAISLWKKCEVDAASVLLCEEISRPVLEEMEQRMAPRENPFG